MMDMANDRGQEFLWFLSGVAIGTTLGLLFAPESGEATRKRIKGVAKKGRSEIKEAGEKLVHKGRELFEHGRAVADEAAEIFESGRRLVQD
jgi:gas vesicle protein